MACFSNPTKKMCSRVVFIISGILILAGLFAGLFGYFGIEKGKDWKIGDETFPSPTALFGLLAILFGLFTVVTGLLGCAAARFKKCCFTMPFAIFCCIMGICFLIVSVVGLMAQDEAALRKLICDKPDDIVNQRFQGKYESLTQYMEDNYGKTVNRFMCTPLCPCNQADSAVWDAALDGTLSQGNRVKQWDHLDPAQQAALGDDENQPWTLQNADVTLVPLFWKTADATNVVGEQIFETFQQCYDKVLKTAWSAEADKQEFMNEAMKFFGDLEAEMDCSGVCWKPLFGIGYNVKLGPVKEECATVLIEQLNSLMGPAIVCAVTTVILFVAFCASIPLCTGYDEDDIMQDKHS